MTKNEQKSYIIGDMADRLQVHFKNGGAYHPKRIKKAKPVPVDGRPAERVERAMTKAQMIEQKGGRSGR